MKSQFDIIRYNELDSTNSEAVRRLENIDNMSVMSAKIQYAGRGKDSNVWLTEPGENLTFTIVLKFGQENSGECPPFPARFQMLVSAMTAASVVHFLRDKGVDAWVKWPNDVYVDKSKIHRIRDIEGDMPYIQLKGRFLTFTVNGEDRGEGGREGEEEEKRREKKESGRTNKT